MFIREANDELDRLNAAGTRRTIRPPAGIDFASNDTLGLRRDPRVIAAACAALREFGLGAGAARLLRGDFQPHRELESEFRKLSGHEDALLFPSGYHANLGVLQTLGRQGWTILSDEFNHASIIDGCRAAKADVEIYPHGSPPERDRSIIVTESVFSMRGDRVSLGSRRAPIIVDEAHALGIFPPDVHATVSVFPCGKALGGSGAVVTGPTAIIELLRSTCRTFLFTTALPPSIAAGVLTALRIAHEEPWRAQRAIELAQRIDPDAESPIVMIRCRDNAHALERQTALAQSGIDVRAVRPPTVPCAALRLSFHSDRTDAEVEQLGEVL